MDQRPLAPDGCADCGQDIRSVFSTAHVGDYVASDGKEVIGKMEESETLALALSRGCERKRGRFFREEAMG